jgi:hypothetical protein
MTGLDCRLSSYSNLLDVSISFWFFNKQTPLKQKINTFVILARYCCNVYPLKINNGHSSNGYCVLLCTSFLSGEKENASNSQMG